MSVLTDLQVRLSLGLSCGHTLPPGEPMRQVDAAGVGHAVICDRCDEYAVVIRTTMRVAELDQQTLSKLLLADSDRIVVDQTTADAIAAEQVHRLASRLLR